MEVSLTAAFLPLTCIMVDNHTFSNIFEEDLTSISHSDASDVRESPVNKIHRKNKLSHPWEMLEQRDGQLDLTFLRNGSESHDLKSLKMDPVNR